MRSRGFSRSAAVITVALFVIATVIYACLQPAIGTPDESRRIVHPHGFSIVQPEGWDAKIEVAGERNATTDSIVFYPHKVVGISGVFYVTALETPPDPKKLASKEHTSITFQGQPAWELTGVSEKRKQHTRTIVFKSADTWYEISVTRPELEPISGKPWQAYFDSVKPAPPSPQSTLSITAGPTLAK